MSSPVLPPHTQSLPHYQCPAPDYTFATGDESALTHGYRPESAVYISGHFWWCAFDEFEQVYTRDPPL